MLKEDELRTSLATTNTDPTKRLSRAEVAAKMVELSGLLLARGQVATAAAKARSSNGRASGLPSVGDDEHLSRGWRAAKAAIKTRQHLLAPELAEAEVLAKQALGCYMQLSSMYQQELEALCGGVLSACLSASGRVKEADLLRRLVRRRELDKDALQQLFPQIVEEGQSWASRSSRPQLLILPRPSVL